MADVEGAVGPENVGTVDEEGAGAAEDVAMGAADPVPVAEGAERSEEDAETEKLAE